MPLYIGREKRLTRKIKMFAFFAIVFVCTDFIILQLVLWYILPAVVAPVFHRLIATSAIILCMIPWKCASAVTVFAIRFHTTKARASLHRLGVFMWFF